MTSASVHAAGFQEGPPVGFGLIGAGSLARRCLAPAIHAARGASLAAVAARDDQRAAALEPDGRSYDDYHALLEDDDVEVVYVALNNAGHLPWTLAALAAGKHVLCEKPLGLSETDVLTMTEAARAAGRLLVEAFWYRWHPRTLRLEQLLRDGSLGQIHGAEAEFVYAGPQDGDPRTAYRFDPAAGGGALYDVGCYALSLVHLAMGADARVSSATASYGPSGVDLGSSALLFDSDQNRGYIRGGISGSPDSQRADVAGSLARASFGAPAFTALFTPVDLTITSSAGAETVEHFGPDDPYRIMVESVAAKVRGEDVFVVDLEHSRQVAASTDAIFADLREQVPAPGGGRGPAPGTDRGPAPGGGRGPAA